MSSGQRVDLYHGFLCAVKGADGPPQADLRAPALRTGSSEQGLRFLSQHLSEGELSSWSRGRSEILRHLWYCMDMMARDRFDRTVIAPAFAMERPTLLRLEGSYSSIRRSVDCRHHTMCYRASSNAGRGTARAAPAWTTLAWRSPLLEGLPSISCVFLAVSTARLSTVDTSTGLEAVIRAMDHNDCAFVGS